MFKFNPITSQLDLVGSGGGTGSPGGADGSVQFNNAGSFDGFGNYDGTWFNAPSIRVQYLDVSVNLTTVGIRATANPLLIASDDFSSSISVGEGYVAVSNGSWLAKLDTTLQNNNYTYQFPDAGGTLALTSDLSGYVPTTRTVNGHALSANVTVTKSDVGLGSVDNVQQQPLDADLTTIAGLTATTDNFIVSVSSAWASRTPSQVRTTLGLVIGTNVQAWDTDLDTWAGKTAPSGTVLGTSDTQTVTNKRITRRVVSVTQSATPTSNTDNADVFSMTGVAQAVTSMSTNQTGTPVAGDTLIWEITDNGTARALTWGGLYEASTVPLPTTTVISTLLTVGFRWNASKWRCVAVA